ncbi:T9SS type A sorting domain-containing protein [Aureispira anguillae]|uniref:T9SS type A sorting domain-containing protein n=1 Tax=Aureispira anguillae TaxID=2864201 RepID=A0A916DUI8_9BACT|nr:T9SS type A sorting domain-containing protein [Aureispira anguillae]BDS12281.1 T9SS type A sorting domain-containing protein [Aureispira anguillae]
MKKPTNYIYLIIYILIITINNHTNAQTWVQKGIDINGGAMAKKAGHSVSLSADGHTIAIGAPDYSNVLYGGSGSESGRVRIYQWVGGNWTQKGGSIYGSSSNNSAGSSVSLSANGNILAIGSPRNSTNGLYAGHVRIYEWNGTTWIKKGTNINGEAAGDLSGGAISLSADGNSVIIGARLNDGIGIAAGHARVYEWNGTDWTQKGVDIDGEATFDEAGQSVSINADGSIIAIGAEENSGGIAGFASGHVRIYQWSGTSWLQKGADIDGEGSGDRSGRAIHLSADGNSIAIGSANNSNSSQGFVRIYNWNGTAWIRKGQSLNERPTSSVSLNYDGNRLAIGSVRSINLSLTGYVRIYSWNGTTWVQEGTDIVGRASNVQSGYSVSLDSLGHTLAIGAIDDYNNGSGHVQIYTTCHYLDTTVGLSGATLTSNAIGMTYQWIDCSNGNSPITGATQQSFTPTTNGLYAVEISNGVCTKTSACTNVTAVKVSVIESQNKYRIFPNPSTDILHIERTNSTNLNIRVVDNLGQIVLSSRSNKTRATLNLQRLKQGVYYLVLDDGKEITYHKFITTK